MKGKPTDNGDRELAIVNAAFTEAQYIIAKLEAELVEARTARDLNRQEFKDAHASCLRAQAEGAAMRLAWKSADDYCGHERDCTTTDRGEQATASCECGYRQAHTAMMLATRGDAGRTFAERVKRLEAVANWAEVVCDETSWTEDSQALVIDPSHIDEMRHRLAALDEKGGG